LGIDEGRLARPFEHVATSQFGYCLVSAPHKRDLPKMRAFREWVATQIASH
jgi:DNA-binding transcriptional LysR family regulator